MCEPVFPPLRRPRPSRPEKSSQAARPAFSAPSTRMGPVALRPRLPTGLPFQEHLLTRSIGPVAMGLEQKPRPNARRAGECRPSSIALLLSVYGKLLPHAVEAVAGALEAVQVACVPPSVPANCVPGPLDWSWIK